MSQQDNRRPKWRKDQPYRRNQNDTLESQDRQFKGHRQNRNQNEQGQPFRKRFIKKNNRHGGKGGKFNNHRQDRDLDRELRDYWITQKGGQGAEVDVKQLAREKLNAEMEQYWKKQNQQAAKAAK